jgi:hypothetical protein
MRRISFFAGLLVTAGIAMSTAGNAGAAMFPECPPVDLDSGCQFLVTVTDTETIIESDPTLGPYEGADDALIGVVNHSSKAVTAIPFSAEIELFGFEDDGLCGVEGAPSGCVVTPLNTGGEPNEHPGEKCTNGTFEGEPCGFPAPAEEPAGLTAAAGASPVGEAANKDPIYGYEGPRTWFSNIGAFGAFTTGSGVVNFGPALQPGETTYFSLESPPAGGFGGASTLTTSLSGGGVSGPSISVLQGTAVTDTATLGGTNATSATGTVSFGVFSDPACTVAVPGVTVASGKLSNASAASGPVTLSAGTYYFRANYAGNTEHQGAVSACGTEVLKVLSPTTTTTAQTGAGLTGPTLTMPQGTAVTDKATIAGALAKTATGSVTYTLYSDSKCTKPVSSSVAAVAGGVAAPSKGVAPKPGTYRWVASYSGDAVNAPSTSACGSEVLLVGFKAQLGLKQIKGCLSKRKITAHPRASKGVKLVSVELLINGKVKSRSRVKHGATVIVLVGLPKGTYVVEMVATDSKGRKYVDIRKFHTCVPKKHHHKKKK